MPGPAGTFGRRPSFLSLEREAPVKQPVGKEAQSVTTTWEVIVRLDDGRFRVFVLDEPPEVQQDDKVRIEEGRIVPR